MLEAEPDRSPGRPMDQQNDLPKFLVQVKSTEQQVSAPRIKLSALKHLVDADLPAAIVILYYQKGARRSRHRLLVPVDEALISDTLRRVREEEARGNRDIHRVKVQVPLASAMEIGKNGEGLYDALHAMLGSATGHYSGRKARFRETCGFDDGPARGTFFVPGPDAGERIGDLLIGERKTLEVRHFTVERTRFGIPLQNDQFYMQEALLEMALPPLMDASIEIEAESGEWTAFPVEVFVAPPFMEEGYSKFRLVHKFFEATADFRKGWFSFAFDYAGDREASFEEAVGAFELGAVLAQPRKTLTLRFKDAELPLHSNEQGPFAHWIPAAPVLRRIAAAIGRSGRRPRGPVRFGAFCEWVDENIELLALCSTPGVNLFFPAPIAETFAGGQDTVIIPMTLEVAGIQYTAVVEVPVASFREEGGDFIVVGGQPTVIDDVVRAVGSDASDFVALAVEASKRRRKVRGPALVVGGAVQAVERSDA